MYRSVHLCNSALGGRHRLKLDAVINRSQAPVVSSMRFIILHVEYFNTHYFLLHLLTFTSHCIMLLDPKILSDSMGDGSGRLRYPNGKFLECVA